MRRLLLMPLVLAALACSLLGGAATPTPFATLTAPPPTTAAPAASQTPTAVAGAPTATATVEAATPTTAATGEATPGATETTAAAQSFIAYVQGGQLLVTDVTGGVMGGTTQYTQPGVDDQVTDLEWSPSGEFVAYTGIVGGDQHLFYVFAVGAGTPVDLGPGALPAWSPDSTRLAYVRDNNIWITPIESPAPMQLSFETNWAWGRPVFTPGGEALVVTGSPFDLMGAQGNTQFTLQTLSLDGSGTLRPLPGATTEIGGRLPYDLAFSPDGAHLAFSTSFHISACASSFTYWVADADGSNLRELVSPSMAALANTDAEDYLIGYGYAWTPDSQGLLQSAFVVDCTDFAGTITGGPQMSVVSLAGDESAVISGLFDSLSFDRTGSLIGAAWRADNASPGEVRLYSRDGTLVLEVGAGEQPEFQP